ncbi:MAG TPA: DUF2092 domain-containing protein [Phycisphaerales bacterium]|nr:DUF2092 domain-containing protein [Phycisphaerales bacterium]
MKKTNVRKSEKTMVGCKWFLVAGLALVGCTGLYMTGASGESQESDAESVHITDGIKGIEAQADRILRGMSDYLKAHREYNFYAEITYDSTLSNDQEIQYGGTSDVSVRRPDKLHMEYRGDERQSRVVFDGKTITLCDLAANVYSVMEVPSEIDAAVDHVFEKYNFSVPIADMVYSDTYRILTEEVQTGFLVGRHAVDGIPCHHLAFTQEHIDWQIWIEDGPRPVPRKLVITYTDEQDWPQYSARFTRWDFQPDHSESYFRFQPPAGADQIDVLPTKQKEIQP